MIDFRFFPILRRPAIRLWITSERNALCSSGVLSASHVGPQPKTIGLATDLPSMKKKDAHCMVAMAARGAFSGMHTPIPSRSATVVCVIVLALAGCKEKKNAPPALPAASVATVQRGNISHLLSVAGQFQAYQVSMSMRRSQAMCATSMSTSATACTRGRSWQL